MGVFDDNIISKEHPLEHIFNYVKSTIEDRFRMVILDVGWNPNKAAKVFENEFRRKKEFFKTADITNIYVHIQSYSLHHWYVVVLIQYSDDDKSYELYHEYIPRNWEDVNNIQGIDMSEFLENLSSHGNI